MKISSKKVIFALFLLPAFVLSCGNSYKVDIPDWNYEKEDEGQEEPEKPAVPKTPTLLVTENWKSDTLYSGLVYHNFEDYDEISEAKQIVNVLEIDLNNDDYRIGFTYTAGGSPLSDVMKKNPGAVGGVNAGYELEAIYVKVNNAIISEVTLPQGHLRFWKHEAAIYSNGDRNVGILYGGKDGVKAIDAYKGLKAENIIASAPMLIEDYKPIGKDFVGGSYTMEELNQFDYEDYRRHQGVRHPRTAYALTEDNDLLLVTVDGRWEGRAEGMNASELTRFLAKYFNPRYAINMDGGGSTTLCVEGHGHPETNVVNYPTDGGTHDHSGERSVSTHLLVFRNSGN